MGDNSPRLKPRLDPEPSAVDLAGLATPAQAPPQRTPCGRSFLDTSPPWHAKFDPNFLGFLPSYG